VNAILFALVAQVASGSPAGAVDRVLLREDYQVLQRDARDEAACLLPLPPGTEDQTAFVVTVEDADGNLMRQEDSAPIEPSPAEGRRLAIDHLKVGGPYTISVAAKEDPAQSLARFQRILVGDIWILGGQSNMFGIDRIQQELPEVPYLNMLDIRHIEMDSHWRAGVPPIHRIPESLAEFVVRAQYPEYSVERVREIVASQAPVGGIDCSYFFARQLQGESGVPIGLIPCATGGALAIWDPRHAATNRYGFLMHHIARAGGRVKGMLFFQGEQDAIFGDRDVAVTQPSQIDPVSTYGEQFTRFVEALRAEVHNPDMPVIYAQICRHHNGPDDRDWGWEAVREAQRRLPQTLPHAYCVPSIDLDVMDGLHLDYDSLRRMGQRMAHLALPYTRPEVPGREEIRVVSATRLQSPKPRILVRFSGVRGRLQAPGRPTGFVFKNAQGELVDRVFKVEFDPAQPDAVILWMTGHPGPEESLYYGAGAAPYVNIVDEDDMALPAFGPILPD
jgi:sialate O-acetylesterase